MSYFALDRTVFVDATIRASLKPSAATIVRFSVSAVEPWQVLLTAVRVEQFIAPTYAVAETVIRRGRCDETEQGLLLVMARPAGDFPSGWSGLTAPRALGVVARLRMEDERRRIRTGARTLGATSDTTRRRWLAEAIRRGFLDADSYSLTEKGLAFLKEKAERGKIARESK